MNEELKKKIQKELLDPIKDPRRVMKMEYLFSHKYILIAVIIAVDLFLIMAFSFLFHMVGMIPRILGGREIQLFALRNFLPDFTKMPIQGGLAALLIIFIADAYLIYRIRVSWADKGFNVGQEGTDRFTTAEEIQEQYTEIAPLETPYHGNPGVLVSRIGNQFYIDQMVVNNLILGITRSGKGETMVKTSLEIYSRAENRPSLIINDPKIELYKSFRGDYVRVIDVVGEFTDEIRALAGRTLDMSRYIINLLEIFRSGENEEMNYARHLAKLRTSYKFLCPEADGKEINDFTEIVEALYKSWGLKPNGENQITGLPAKAYPIFGDLLEYVDQEIEAIVGKKWRAGEKILVERKLINLDRIRSNLRLITSTYGSVFNGHTSVDNMKDVKALSYDLSKLKDMDANIFDLELFNILSLSWDDAVTNGAIMKKLWEEKKIALEDVAHTILYIDESHRSVNAQKPYALDLLSIYLREGPKYFSSIWLASQSIRDYVPEGSTTENIEKLKLLFELTQYKFIFKQDRNVIPLIDRIFGNALTPRQRERIPLYSRGQTTLLISGDQTIDFKVYLSKEDEALFKGGA